MEQFAHAEKILLASADDLFLDIESNGLDSYTGNQLCGVGVGTLTGEIFYFPFRHKTAGTNLPKEAFIRLIEIINKAKRIYAYNIKFDARFLENEGVDFSNKVMVDVIVMVRLTEHSSVGKLGLEATVLRRYGEQQASYDSETKILMKQNGWDRDFSLCPPEILGEYCIKDVYYLWLLYKDCLAELRRTEQMGIWAKMLDSTTALFEMERWGVHVDQIEVEALEFKITKRMKELAVVIYADAGADFNIASSAQVGKLFNSRGIVSPTLSPKCSATVEKKQYAKYCNHVEKGVPHTQSWAEDVLVQIDAPLAGLIKQYRTLAKLLSTYLMPYKSHDVMHSTFANWGTGTGRLSSLNPNFQNMPAKVTYISERILTTLEEFTEVRERVKAVALNKGKVEILPKLSDETIQSWAFLGGDKYTGAEGECHLRTVIKARPGFKLVSMDYSQMEVRVLLFYLDTPEAWLLLRKPDVDFHAENAKLVYDIDEDHPEFSFYRALAKTITFGMLYGMGEKKLAMTLQIARMQARTYKNKFINSLPGFKAFKQSVERSIERTGTLRNRFGRLYQINRNDAYKGINFIIQGTSADIVTERFVECVKYLRDKETRLLIQVHDELVFEVRDTEYHEVIPELKAIMETNSLGIPLTVDVEVDKGSWAEKTAYVALGAEKVDNSTNPVLQFIDENNKETL